MLELLLIFEIIALGFVIYKLYAKQKKHQQDINEIQKMLPKIKLKSGYCDIDAIIDTARTIKFEKFEL